LNWNLRWVVGYPGSTDLRMALERGEIDTTTFATDPDIADVMKSGKFKIELQSGFLEGGKIVGRSEYGSAPVFSELLASKV
jgi:hypothetical protein